MLEPLDVPEDTLRALEAECDSAASPRAFAPLAEAYRLAGRLEDARRVAGTGLEAFPEHHGMRLVLARTLMDSGDQGAAREQYGRVLERDPSNQEAAASLAACGEQGAEPKPAVESHAGEPEPLNLDHGSLSSELEHLSDLFATPAGPRDAPPDAIATLTLAEIYARQGATDRAIEVCEAILRRDPDDREAAARLERYRREMASLA